MLDGRKLLIVARFELAEMVRSRLFVVAMILYGAGASLGSFVFLKLTEAAETTARLALSESLHLDPQQIPPHLIREKALPMFSGFVNDEGISQELLKMPLLSIFHGYMVLVLVPLLVLAISSGTMAADIASGATRYVLFRCGRFTWATGKLLGQEFVLASGLLLGALLSGLVGVAVDSEFAPVTWLWLFRTAFRAWLYANAFLGLFCGISLSTRSPMQARALSLFALLGLGIAQAVVTSDFANQRMPRLHHLAVVFPSSHKMALWSPNYGEYLASVAALFLFGACTYVMGVRVFQGRDA